MLLILLSACLSVPSSGAVSRSAIDRPGPPAPAPPEPWPLSSASIRVLPLPAPRNLDRGRVFLMAGHANGPGRDGNLGVHGQIEAEVTLETTTALYDALAELDRFDLVLGRKGRARPSYDARIAHAARVEADAFIEIHTDARGAMEPWATTPSGDWTYRSEGWNGFSVLYRDTGGLKEDRARLARAVATSLMEAGFEPYADGYGWMYDDDEVPGVFRDRRGLKMLRGPAMPSIIIETHNAKDFDESLRWREPHVQEAFAAALADGLSRYFTR